MFENKKLKYAIDRHKPVFLLHNCILFFLFLVVRKEGVDEIHSSNSISASSAM